MYGGQLLLSCLPFILVVDNRRQATVMTISLLRVEPHGYYLTILLLFECS